MAALDEPQSSSAVQVRAALEQFQGAMRQHPAPWHNDSLRLVE
ncbi:hypothetical protein [Pannonibacter phragmitetus]|nr:hypothetical protein [Pannonibacter phragmitetus]